MENKDKTCWFGLLASKLGALSWLTTENTSVVKYIYEYIYESETTQFGLKGHINQLCSMYKTHLNNEDVYSKNSVL